MSVKLLTEHHLEFLNLKGGCTVLSESRLVLSRCHTVGNHMSLLNFMDKLTDRYQIFESGHIHSYKVSSIFSNIGYQVI